MIPAHQVRIDEAPRIEDDEFPALIVSQGEYPKPAKIIQENLNPVTSLSLQIKDAEAAAATAATVKVRVQKPYRVIHEGKAHIHPDVVAVPEHLATQWESAQWVKRIQSKKEK